MNRILEIRDGCKTPLELFKSNAFEQYLNLYKKQFISELESREETDQKEEVLHKKDFVDKISPLIFIEIL